MKCPHCDVMGPQWKIQDHESNICMEKVIPCTNSPYGCDLMLKRQVLFNKQATNTCELPVLIRKEIINHLYRCPAAVSHCTMVPLKILLPV